MADALRRALRAFRVLNLEQKAAAVGALLLIASTFGPFSFVELAEILIALGARAEGKRFHLPFGDGTVIAGAGIWAGLLIVVRLLDRSLGQNLLALACAAILFLAGARERAKRPADDLPPELAAAPDTGPDPGRPGPAPPREPRAAPGAAEAETEPLPPPEFEPYRPQSGEQLRLAEEPAEDESETRRRPEGRPPDT